MCPADPLPPCLLTWLIVVYMFPIRLWPRGGLLSWLLGPLLWHLLSRLCCEGGQVGDLMPSSLPSVLVAGTEKGLDGGTGWAYRQVGLHENEKALGRRVSGTLTLLLPQG